MHSLKTITGHCAIVDHLFLSKSVKKGSRWVAVDNSGKIVVIVGVQKSTNEVYFKCEETGRQYEKDLFIFQTRYCLIADGLNTEEITQLLN